jgi:uncharacterized protein (TIGR00255 family)
MIKSMTGYGKATAATGAKTITVEVRSLNSKGLDLSVKMPSAYRSSEYEMRSMASAKVSRGKTDIYVNVEDGSGAGGARVNAELFGAYYRQIKEAAKQAGVVFSGAFSETDDILIPAIMRLPDVMVTENTEVPEEESAALLRATAEALEAFDAFRAQEGAILFADMSARVDTIGELLARVEPFEVARVPAVKARIMDNIAAVGVTADANRLEQEIVFWVEKLDITEEKVRLTKHLNYFRETAGEKEAGRKLGFIAQEMGREINTLGSKANDADIQKLVVQMKDELEKIKEQLLNIL